MLDKIEFFRQSMLKTYIKCPRMFYLQYAEGYVPEKRKVNLLRGSSVHEAIRAVHKNSAWSDWKDVYDYSWDNILKNDADADIPFELSNEEETLEEALESAKEDGEEIFKSYVDQDHNKKAEILFSEVDFKTFIGGHEIRGTIDQVRLFEDLTYLMDFKSDLNMPSPVYLQNDIQFKIYYHALNNGLLYPEDGETKFNGNIDKLSWYHLRNNIPYKKKSTKAGKVYNKGDIKGSPFLLIDRCKNDLPLIEEDISSIIKAIQLKIFYKNPQTTGTCSGFCRYNNACLGLPQMKATDRMKNQEVVDFDILDKAFEE